MDIEQWLYSLPLRLRSFFYPNQVDQEMKEELREHLEQQIRENIAKGMSPEEARRSAMRARALSTITDRITGCRDPKDDKFLELAVNGHADLIVTGDRDLLALNPFRGIPIVTPAAFVQGIAR